MGKPNPTHCLPLAKAPFRYRAQRLPDGSIGPAYPDLTPPSARVSHSYDVLVDTLLYSLPDWDVRRSVDGFGFDLEHQTLGALYNVHPAEVVAGCVHLSEPQRA